MEGKQIGGLLLLIIGVLTLSIIVVVKISQFIRIRKLKFKSTKGVVINSIKTSDPEYLKKRNEEIFKKYESARTAYNVLSAIFPTVNMEEEKYRGSVYASIIQYKVDNKKYEVISNFSSDKKEKKGKSYRVRYNPTNPSEAFIINDRGKIIWFIIITALIGFGIKLLLF